MYPGIWSIDFADAHPSAEVSSLNRTFRLIINRCLGRWRGHCSDTAKMVSHTNCSGSTTDEIQSGFLQIVNFRWTTSRCRGHGRRIDSTLSS
jgi:hypothetical protein